jgi:hypothetical protein
LLLSERVGSFGYFGANCKPLRGGRRMMLWRRLAGPGRWRSTWDASGWPAGGLLLSRADVLGRIARGLRRCCPTDTGDAAEEAIGGFEGAWHRGSCLISCWCRRMGGVPRPRNRDALLPIRGLRPGLEEVTRQQALGDVDLELMLGRCLPCRNVAFSANGGGRLVFAACSEVCGACLRPLGGPLTGLGYNL